MRWMADVYTLYQWMYNISSKELSKTVPAREMWKIYTPLHETSEKNACKIINRIYFEGEKNDCRVSG